MKKKCNTVKTIPKSNIRIVEKYKIDTTNKIHDRSLSWLGTGTSVRSSVVKQVIWAQTLLSNCNWDHSEPTSSSIYIRCDKNVNFIASTNHENLN